MLFRSLDPAQLVGIRDLIRSFAGAHTVILSTHILQEVEAVCPKAMIIAKGKLRAQGTLDDLRALAPSGAWYRVEVTRLDGPALGALAEVELVEPLGEDGPWRSFKVHARTDPRPAIAELVRAQGAQVRTLEHRLPTLEEAFIGVVGQE